MPWNGSNQLLTDGSLSLLGDGSRNRCGRCCTTTPVTPPPAGDYGLCDRGNVQDVIEIGNSVSGDGPRTLSNTSHDFLHGTGGCNTVVDGIASPGLDLSTYWTANYGEGEGRCYAFVSVGDFNATMSGMISPDGVLLPPNYIAFPGGLSNFQGRTDCGGLLGCVDSRTKDLAISGAKNKANGFPDEFWFGNCYLFADQPIWDTEATDTALTTLKNLGFNYPGRTVTYFIHDITDIDYTFWQARGGSVCKLTLYICRCDPT